MDLNLALVTPERFPGGLESCFSYFMSAFLVDLNLALLLLSAFLVDLNLAVVTPEHLSGGPESCFSYS